MYKIKVKRVVQYEVIVETDAELQSRHSAWETWSRYQAQFPQDLAFFRPEQNSSMFVVDETIKFSAPEEVEDLVLEEEYDISA
jgi:hypothetical protein